MARCRDGPEGNPSCEGSLMAEHCGRLERLGDTISGRGTKGLEAGGPSNPRVGNRFQGGGHRVELGGKGAS